MQVYNIYTPYERFGRGCCQILTESEMFLRVTPTFANVSYNCFALFYINFLVSYIIYCDVIYKYK